MLLIDCVLYCTNCTVQHVVCKPHNVQCLRLSSVRKWHGNTVLLNPVNQSQVIRTYHYSPSHIVIQKTGSVQLGEETVGFLRRTQKYVPNIFLHIWSTTDDSYKELFLNFMTLPMHLHLFN
jgi:hypothetical protein